MTGRLQGLLLGALSGLARCGGSPSAPAPASVAPPPPPTFDCGSLRPNLHTSCHDGDPVSERHIDLSDETTLSPGAPGYAGESEIKDCDLGVTPGDLGAHIRTTLSAVCSPAPGTPDDASAQIDFHAYATRRCAPGPRGSGASASPYWRGTLMLPGPPGTRYRLSVSGTLSRDLQRSCSLTVAGAPSDPLNFGQGAQLATQFAGPGSVDIVLDCSLTESGLAATSCVGFTEGQLTSAFQVDTTLSLVIEARRCASSGC